MLEDDLHSRAESRRQALKKDMTPEQLYSLIMEEIDDIYANNRWRPINNNSLNLLIFNTMYTETTDTKGINVEVDETDAVPYTDMEREVYSPEEAYELIMSDIKSIYGIKDAV